MLKIWTLDLDHANRSRSSGSSSSFLLLPFVHKLMLPEVVGSPCDISAEVAFVSEQFLTMFSLHMPSKISFVAKVLPSTSGTPPGPINLGHMHGHIRRNDFSFPTCKIVIASLNHDDHHQLISIEKLEVCFGSSGFFRLFLTLTGLY